MHGTLPLQQSHYSTYSTVLRPITLKVCSIYNEKGLFFTLHRVTYRRADAHLTPVQV